MTSPFYDPFNGNGRIVFQSIDSVVWEADLEDGTTVRCEQQLVGPIIDNNKEAYALNHGKRWGTGKIVASTPLDIYIEKILPARLNGDEKYIRKFHNDIDNRGFRRFHGKL